MDYWPMTAADLSASSYDLCISALLLNVQADATFYDWRQEKGSESEWCEQVPVRPLDHQQL